MKLTTQEAYAENKRLKRERDALADALRCALQSMDARPKDSGLHYVRELCRAALAQVRK